MTGEPGRARTVFFGSGRFGLSALARLARREDVEVAAVVTAPPRPVGRRQALTPTPIHEAAATIGLDVLAPSRLRDPEAVAAVLDLRPTVAVLADYGQLVPAPILDLAAGALNLHPSLLPRHRGATPISATILAGDRRTGVTLFRMDEGLDSGPIVAVREVQLSGRETGPELHDRLAAVAADLLDETLGPWLRGEIEARPQPAEGVTLTRPLRREDGRLDPAAGAAALERAVRAYAGWPGTFMEAGGARLRVLRAEVARGEPGDRPGLLVEDAGEGLALTTPEGRLRLLEVQAAGRGAMPAAAFRRGHPGIVGATVEGGPAARDAGSAEVAAPVARAVR